MCYDVLVFGKKRRGSYRCAAITATATATAIATVTVTTASTVTTTTTAAAAAATTSIVVVVVVVPSFLWHDSPYSGRGLYNFCSLDFAL